MQSLFKKYLQTFHIIENFARKTLPHSENIRYKQTMCRGWE